MSTLDTIGNPRLFIALSTVCFIAVGMGFIAFLPYLLDYEAAAVKAGYSLEQKTGLNYSKGIECESFPEILADCNYTNYLLDTTQVVVRLLRTLLFALLFIGFSSAIVGFNAYRRWNTQRQYPFNPVYPEG